MVALHSLAYDYLGFVFCDLFHWLVCVLWLFLFIYLYLGWLCVGLGFVVLCFSFLDFCFVLMFCLLVMLLDCDVA